MINFNKIIFIYEFTNSTKGIIAVIGKKIIIIFCYFSAVAVAAASAARAPSWRQTQEGRVAAACTNDGNSLHQACELATPTPTPPAA